MHAGFKGFPAEAMTFFRGLARNNNREWFLAHKHIYEERVKAPMVELVNALNTAMMEFAPAYVTDPAKAIYRIYRDVRFSADKTPYKTTIAASFSRRSAAKHAAAGYYIGIGAKEVEAAGGLYLPPPETLRVLRAHLAEHHKEFRRVAETRAIRRLLGEVQGSMLARVPKGFAADHPAADLLRYKQCYLYVVLDPAIATTPRLFGELLERFRAMTGFVDFLNTPLVAARAKRTVNYAWPD
jgi:uncharacterized protein (TIGR02453 family)